MHTKSDVEKRIKQIKREHLTHLKWEIML